MSSLRQLMEGRFTLIRPLGRGAMGSVWLADQRATGRQVAVKIMTHELQQNELAVGRFRREARAVAQIRSRHIVQIIDYDIDPSLGPFIAMELLEGETLGSRLRRESYLDPPMVARVVRQIARALSQAHRANIVHRDLKPDNVFLEFDEDGPEIVKVLDFGLAKTPLAVGEFGTHAGVVIGSLTHMSPEQTQGDCADHRADLWSLGVLAYQCMTGALPFPQTSAPEQIIAICQSAIKAPSTIREDIPIGFDDWCTRALERDREQRFQQATQMAEELDSICHCWCGDASAPGDRRQWSENQRNAPFYVRDHGKTVGPVSRSLLNKTIDGGTVTGSALVWRKGLREWVRADELDSEAKEPEKPSSANPPTRPTWTVGPINPADMGYEGKGLPIVRGQYFVTDGTTTIGPMVASQLIRGVEEGRIPRSAMVLRHGWRRWRPLTDVVPGLALS